MEHIGKSLRTLLSGPELADGIAGWRAVEAWSGVVGSEIAARSQAVRYADGTLFVEVQSSTWLQELSFLRCEIVEKLNENLGREIISSIRFSIAGGGRHSPGKG